MIVERSAILLSSFIGVAAFGADAKVAAAMNEVAATTEDQVKHAAFCKMSKALKSGETSSPPEVEQEHMTEYRTAISSARPDQLDAIARA